MLFVVLVFVVTAMVLLGGHSVVVACKAVSDFGGDGVDGGGDGRTVVTGGDGDSAWMNDGF